MVERFNQIEKEVLCKLVRTFPGRVFVVGGAVRDHLLGHEPDDVDFVVECTEGDFEWHFPDSPKINTDFPVYSVDGVDVALTRSEKSTGDGYGDFEVDDVGVHISIDLKRRDFTINSIAWDCTHGRLYDPVGGKNDIDKRIIRSVFEEAFEEDPIRILRFARFASRFASLGFSVDLETATRAIKESHRVSHVKQERFVKELEKVWSQSERPSVFFNLLNEIGCLKHWIPELAWLAEVPAGPAKYHGSNTALDHTLETIDRAKELGLPFDSFVALLFHDLGKGTTKSEILPHHYGHEIRSFDLTKAVLERSRFKRSTNKFAPTFALQHMRVHQIEKLRSTKLIRLVRSIPAELRHQFILTASCDHELSEQQLKRYSTACKAVAEAPVAIPTEVLARGREAIVQFVENVYVKHFEKLERESR